jgi:membrane fusion protein (multidrug efflux system)
MERKVGCNPPLHSKVGVGAGMRMRFRISTVLLATLILIMITDCRRPRRDKGSEDNPEVMAINVEAAYPERRDMDEVIEVNGNLEPVVHVEIFARQSGLIEEIFKEEGDRVEKDDLLAKVDDDEIRLSYEQARLAYQVAREKYQRYKGLFQKNMVSTQEFEDIERAYNDAKVNMDSARLRLEYTDITTPVSGTVVERMCEPQQLVGTMEKVFAVAQLHQFKIPIFITEAEIGKIEENQDVRIRVDALNPDPAVYPYTGYIDHISPRINPSNGMVEVRVMLKNPGELKMGMFCRLKIITARRTDALVIPKKALMGEEINQVWVVDGDRGQLREVVTGIRDDKYVEILSGIKPEEMVITEGQTALTEKSRIRIVNMQDEALEKHGEEPL